MTIHVDELRKLLDTGEGQEVELPGEMLGLGDVFQPFFPDGVLRLASSDGHSGALRAVGAAVTSLADRPVRVCATFSHDGSVVTAVALDIELPAPGTRADELARVLGVDVPHLPGPDVDRITLARNGAGATLTAAGPRGRAALSQDARLFVAEADGWRMVCCEQNLTEDQLAILDIRATGGLAAGSWLVLPDGSVVPVKAPLAVPRLDASRVDGLGRVMPERTATTRRRGLSRPLRAIATRDGFAVLGVPAPGRERGFKPIGNPLDGQGLGIDYSTPPLRIAGTLTVLPAQAPYKTIIGGVLLFSFDSGDSGKGLYGTGMGAYVVPQAGTDPSFFAFAAIGSNPGIGIPALRLNGIAAGMGWNSRIRVPEVEEIGVFPFIKALTNPGAIGAEKGNPVKILGTLVGGDNPWIRPAQDELWVAAGLAFTVAEFVEGRAMALLQTGPELTVALLGMGGVDFPKGGTKKYARAEIGVRAVIKPLQGELAIEAALTPSSFLLDPNCRLRGGVALKSWFGESPHAGDLVLSVGGYHPKYQVPAHYPRPTRVGFDWALGGNVTVSGNAYFALTPAAVMAGGDLDIQFHAGPVRAWCVAKVDLLIQWKPFYIDASLKISIGVSASIKIWFIRISITIEVGVSLQLWGPAFGGSAEVHLWFISFTINFGASRPPQDRSLDWAGFREMLPPPESAVRVLPGAGLIENTQTDGTRSDGAWEVSAAGFSFTTDSTVPVTQLYLNTKAGTPAESGSLLNIRPMQQTGRTSVQCVSLTREGESVDLTTWSRARTTASVAQALWGTGAGNTLPAKDGDQLIANQLTGVRLAAPPLRNGTSTGYISEEALKFDPVNPDGHQPLKATDGPVGAIPARPSGVIATIATTVAAATQITARGQLAGVLAGLGLNLGLLDNDLSAYARAAQATFTAEPMLVPAA
ncbi:DUF6603 domain-containing protein [Kitasatospora sp. NPDC058397]|uniref:DUF6603 domain-containing protein n=1 Tax=Kitasatospora sp. NPDC058397 TaxID=3346478 RepID=UPI003655B5E8